MNCVVEAQKMVLSCIIVILLNSNSVLRNGNHSDMHTCH